MRIAIISDAHGNLHALDAVLADLDNAGPFDEVIYGGDFAFRGVFPAQVIDRIRERDYRAVRGNTDEFLVEMATEGAFKPSITDERQRHTTVLQALDRWALEHMEPDQIDYLGSLPLHIDISGPGDARLTIVHATPWSAHPAIMPDVSDDVAVGMLDAADASSVAYGHIHQQYSRRVGDRLLTSVGSVGAPLDRDPRAAYAILSNDGHGWQVELQRVSYDIESAVAELLASTLPEREKIAVGLRIGAPVE